MFLESRRSLFIFAVASLLACGGGGGSGSGSSDTDSGSSGGTAPSSGPSSATTDSADDGTTDDDTGNDDGPQPANQAPSARPRVKFKTAERYAADLSTALSLPRSELCSELDAFDCVTVHRIALGEVDAFGLRLFEPLAKAPLTAPIAVDRIGLTACGERAERDFESPGSATSFAEIADGNADDASNRDAVVARLYRQLLLREASDSEVELVSAMYGDLPEDGRAQTWAQMACFAIATSTEALFY